MKGKHTGSMIRLITSRLFCVMRCVCNEDTDLCACFHLTRTRALARGTAAKYYLFEPTCFNRHWYQDAQKCPYESGVCARFLDYDLDKITGVCHFTPASDDTTFEREHFKIIINIIITFIACYVLSISVLKIDE